ncbi:cytoplasmic aconitate hydratase-like isoform X2 [Pollicipes pollicipes]|uniref:cytoplasmic aconitate hydratase-like isoform X2 n=1 Tax=Pollicipes pollicipes TaxID=41117 RepID=UPI0018854A01|nr:cytoplasmic aconitate hydratase-like isoform X2 [Pollicipes pollicipes]
MGETAPTHRYHHLLRQLRVDGRTYRYYDVTALDDPRYAELPFSIRVLLEAAVRCWDGAQVREADVEALLDWRRRSAAADDVQVAFRPGRVILQDFTGVPAVVDLAAMREAVEQLGGEPGRVNPVCPADLVIDHSVQVDFSRASDALRKNQELEFDRNSERFQFLKWGSAAFANMRVLPPGSGIVHQVNLEYLARVVFDTDDLLRPDSLVGTDSHTTMINGLGVLGWGVGGLEAEAAMLGRTVGLTLPQVVGYKITGRCSPLATATDIVLTVTKHLRQVGVVGKFVEFFGPGVSQLSIADRATISNMCPEYGATVGFFPVDGRSLDYLLQTGRQADRVAVMRAYLAAAGLLRDYAAPAQDPAFSQVVELDLATVVPSVSGPKRPHDRVAASQLRDDFLRCLSAEVGFKGFGVRPERLQERRQIRLGGRTYSLGHGSVVIAAITSCTNTSNPSVMLGAGILARKAVERGLSVPPWIKTSLSPGSGVVTHYLQDSGVLPALRQLGFGIVGYGCMTCIGNSGPLPRPVVEAVQEADLVCCGVLSGNRNFEGRVHPHVRANYLASPPLVIAYALAGRVDIDFETTPLGTSENGDVYLRDIWPSRQEIHELESKSVIPAIFADVYSKITKGNASWSSLQVPDSDVYRWQAASTYIQPPTLLQGMTREPPPLQDIEAAHALLVLGDSVTTDHISPAGSIARSSPAARYLTAMGLTPRQFNSYGSRRGCEAVMVRGTFANTRLANRLLRPAGPRTVHLPSGLTMDVFDAAERYRAEQRPLLVLAGRDYGCGSSRDWAAKGPALLGVRAVLAESFDRVHRSNLVGVGVLPLQYRCGESAAALALSGREALTVRLPRPLTPRAAVDVQTDDGRSFQVTARLDSEAEVTLLQHGGLLRYMVRQML